jgi:hypothetical protein
VIVESQHEHFRNHWWFACIPALADPMSWCSSVQPLISRTLCEQTICLPTQTHVTAQPYE